MSKQLLSGVGETTPDNLVNSPIPPALTLGVTIRAGQGELARGTVLALSTGEAGDGSMVVLGTEAGANETLHANCILSDPVDASGAGTVSAVAYRTGHFNRNRLIMKDAYPFTVVDEEYLRYGGILLSDAQE